MSAVWLSLFAGMVSALVAIMGATLSHAQSARASRREVEQIRLWDANAPALRPACAHIGAVPVESVVTGEVLAHWCPSCEVQLAAAWVPRVDAMTSLAIARHDGPWVEAPRRLCAMETEMVPGWRA